MPLGPLIAEKLGRCPRCLGLSLGLSICSWALLSLAFLAGAGLALTILLFIPAAALAALFLAHITAFSIRALRTEPDPCSTCGGSRERHLHEVPRRQVLGIFGSAIIAAAVLSLSNIPGVRRVLAQDPPPCEDVGGPLKQFDPVCVTAGETEEQLKQRLLKAAQEWITANEGTFEATARGNCRDRGCKNADQRCIAAHYTVNAHVNCFDSRQCESGRACQAGVSMGVRCRCVNPECGTAKLNPPVEISVEVCTDQADPSKEELQAACDAAGKQVETMAQAAAERTCDQQTCPPKGGTRPKCKPHKVDKTKTECARVKDRKNCCRCTTTIKSVQCKC
jgi:hypothetical protein